jgi:RHS repeat-associated protein
LAMLRSGATSYFHADGLGSITSLSNAAGSIANTYTYDSFGKLTASTGSLVNPYQYTARESDSETDLYYYRARYYDTSTGRFLSEDPIGFESGNNFYAYVRNEPLGLIDPSGEDSVTIGPVTIPLPWTRCSQDAWYCTNVMTPSQIAAEDAHEADHRLRWRDHIPGWAKEKLGFIAEVQFLKKRIAELESKKCLTEAEKGDLEGARKQLQQAEPLANWGDDFPVKFYWNENARRWWQKRVPY